ncbi:MAG: YjbH domain-containing protein, partial [Stenotrophomonas sp.]
MQTPTARMADEGEVSITASYTSPYSRYTVSMQPMPWLEGSFRYISIANRRYGHASLSGNQNYKDKSIDLKVRLLQEDRWQPEVSIGARDIGGTGLFSSEYLVANKRFGSFDASLGLATGYIGNRGDFSNPLKLIDDRFQTRPNHSNEAGELNTSGMFRGPVGVFAGIAYQTPWEPLQIKLEYEGNDYRHEPQRNHQRQRLPLNVGLAYALN